MLFKEEIVSKCGRYVVVSHFEKETQKHPYGDAFVTETISTLIHEDFFVDDSHYTFEELSSEEREIFKKLLGE